MSDPAQAGDEPGQKPREEKLLGATPAPPPPEPLPLPPANPKGSLYANPPDVRVRANPKGSAYAAGPEAPRRRVSLVALVVGAILVGVALFVARAQGLF